MKLWIFDLDGTLVDSFSHYFKALEDIFTEYGKVFDNSLGHAALTDPLPQFFEKHLGKELALEGLEKLQQMSNDHAKDVRPFEGMIETIEGLIKQGKDVAIWTNRDLHSATLIIQASKLDKLFSCVVSGTCVTLRKPHPEGILRIAKQFNCELKDVTVIGDHEHDVQGAKTAGARAVRASWHSYWQVAPCETADHQFFGVSNFSQWVLGQIATN